MGHHSKPAPAPSPTSGLSSAPCLWGATLRKVLKNMIYRGASQNGQQQLISRFPVTDINIISRAGEQAKCCLPPKNQHCWLLLCTKPLNPWDFLFYTLLGGNKGLAMVTETPGDMPYSLTQENDFSREVPLPVRGKVTLAGSMSNLGCQCFLSGVLHTLRVLLSPFLQSQLLCTSRWTKHVQISQPLCDQCIFVHAQYFMLWGFGCGSYALPYNQRHSKASPCSGELQYTGQHQFPRWLCGPLLLK